MWHDLGTVFWLEYRRHMRSRKFWQTLLVIAGVASSLAVGYAWLISVLESNFNLSHPIGIIALLLLCAMNSLMTLVALLAIPRIFGDLYKTREIHDLYLTRLHPVAIVGGRLATLWVQVGLIQLALLPAGSLICYIGGFSFGYWMQVNLLTWCALLVVVGGFVRSAEKYFPSDSVGTLSTPPSRTSSMVQTLMLALIVFSAGFIVIDMLTPSSWTREGVDRLPVMLFFPPLIPFVASLSISIGGWVIPSWWIGLPMMVGFLGLTVVASAQWLGWWSDGVYRYQRIIGSGFFIVCYLINLALYAQFYVQSAIEAQQVVFWSAILAWYVYIFIFAPLLGYYGMGQRPHPARYGLTFPLGGIVWEWGLGVGIALTSWLTVGIVSGYWVEPTRWLVWNAYLMSLLLLAQAIRMPWWVYLWLRFRYPNSSALMNTADMRVFVERLGASTVKSFTHNMFVLWGIIWFVRFILDVLAGYYSAMRPIAWKLTRFLEMLHPVRALSSASHSELYYLYYTAYALVLALIFGVWGVVKGRNAFFSNALTSQQSQPQRVEESG